MDSAKTYKTIFENLPFIVFTLDKDGKLLDVNRYTEDLTGITLEEFKGKGLAEWSVLDKKDLLKVSAEFRKNLKGEVTERDIYSLKLKDGRELLLELAGIPLIEDDKVTRVLVVGSDITSVKRAVEDLKDSEERLKLIFESAPDGYYLNDLRGVFLDGNRAAEEITGYKKEELIGKNFLRMGILPQEQLPKAAALLAQSVLGRSTGPSEFTLNRKDGNQIEVEIRTHLIKIKGKTVVLGVARNITERKQAEEQVRSMAKFPSEDPYPVIRVKKDGIILYSNPAGLPLLKKWDCKVGESVPEHWQYLILEAYSSGVNKIEEVEVGDFIYSFVIAPVAGAEYINLYGSDITERKWVEKTTRKHLKELEVYYKASRGREERILELKEEIKRLKEEMGKK
ncbi:MAG: PAS domain-containing protein [Candidatus Omnitrophota bacterium]